MQTWTFELYFLGALDDCVMHDPYNNAPFGLLWRAFFSAPQHLGEMNPHVSSHLVALLPF